MPRVRIAEFMAVVAIVALDFGAIRACFSGPPPGIADLVLASGALPMANILAVGLLIGLRRRSRGFLWGFEAFGAAALALFALDYLCGFPMTTMYWDLVDGLNYFYIFTFHINRMPTFYYPEWWPLIFSFPQLVCALFGGLLALFGGLLFRKFR